jgi:hypothetical protein
MRWSPPVSNRSSIAGPRVVLRRKVRSSLPRRNDRASILYIIKYFSVNVLSHPAGQSAAVLHEGELTFEAPALQVQTL